MTNTRIIAGIIVLLIGIVLVCIPLFISVKQSFVFLIYGVPLLIIGIIILLNKKEDKIEGIKDSHSPKSTQSFDREQIKQAGGKK